MSCLTGKHPYAKKAQAKRAAKALRRSTGKPEARVYECAHCGLFHLTSQVRRLSLSERRAA